MPRDEENLTLVLLDDAEYAAFARGHVLEYARQHVNAGEWTVEEAPYRARAELVELLNDSLRSAGHVFLKGVDADDAAVGWLWVAPAPDFLGAYGGHRAGKRWLAQITVDEPRRGRGFGRRLLAALHRRLAAQGVEELWLRVYDWNAPARRLYAAAGYELARKFPTDAHLRCCLADARVDRSQSQTRLL